MNYELTIIVPVYGVEDYLAKCLDSLINQTVLKHKIFAVNDGTKDNCQEIIEEYEKKYPNIVKGFIKENGGLSDARNYGLKYVDTPYVMFIDADDYVENNMVEICLNKIKEGYDIVTFNYYQHHVVDNTFEVISHKINSGGYSMNENKEILAFTSNAAWNKIYKTSLFFDNNIRYPKGLLYEDLGTTPILLHCADRIYFINEPLYHYLVDRPNNITRLVNEKVFDLFTVMKIVIDYYKSIDKFNEYESELYYLFKSNLVDNMRKIVLSKDCKFTNRFIDAAFDMEEKYFKHANRKYEIKLKGTDVVYLNRLAAKTYSSFRKIVKGDM